MAASGSIGRPGLVGGTKEAYTIVNHGQITDTNGAAAIYLRHGGDITNSGTGALIEGYNGISISSSDGTVVNSGIIKATVSNGVGIASVTGKRRCTSFSWKQEGDKGVLTVVQGPDVARITLFGQYVQAGSHGHGDDHGGTVFTYTAPTTQQLALANPRH